MKSFMDKLFDGMIESPEYDNSFGINKESIRIYERLDKLLSGKENKLFNDFADAWSWEQAQMENRIFRYGFKTAILLIVEALQ